MLLLRTCLKKPAAWDLLSQESTALPWHGRSISPSPGLHHFGTMRRSVWPGWASKPSPAAEEKTPAGATPENVLLQSGERLCAPARWLMPPPPHVPAPQSRNLSAPCLTPKTSPDSASKMDSKPAPREGISLSLVIFQISRLPLAL